MPDSAAKGDAVGFQDCGYILHIKEHLASNWSDEFEGLTVTYTPTGETQLSGFIPDQSALHGLLARIRDLNLTLILVSRIAIDGLPGTQAKDAQPGIKMEAER